MDKLTNWLDKTEAKEELGRRLSAASTSRDAWEAVWGVCMRAAYRNGAADIGALHRGSGIMPPSDGDGYMKAAGHLSLDEGKIYPTMYANYLQKDVRFMHSQLSNNPPSVVPQPTSSDPKDRHAADAANNIVKYAIRQYRLQEKKDWTALWALVTGTGFTKLAWDPNLGDPLEFNPETLEIVTQGDIGLTVPSPWDLYFDHTATCWEEVRYAFQRYRMVQEQALLMFGDELKDAGKLDPKSDTAEIFQYWEKGLPVNGYQGRFCWCLRDGTVLRDSLTQNPHGPLTKLPNGVMFRRAKLPFNIFTDVDIPGHFYGIPTILFTAEIQNELNVIDSMVLTNVRAHGANRMLVDETTELGEDTITNNPMDIIKYSGTKPDFISGRAADASIMNLRQQMASSIPDLNGINEAQYGKMSRETSGSAMNYASQNGQALRARTFSKYVQYVEDLYRSLLLVVHEKWTTPRKITVEGKEKSYATMEFIASDIDSGYEFASKYGTDFSLDPNERRKEILELWPILQQLNLDMRQVASMLKLNEIDAMLATIDLAYDRQREIFDRMISDPMAGYIAPEDLRDHKNMLAYGYNYMMTAEFDRISNPAVKFNIERHVKEREKLEAAKQVAATPPAAGAAAAPSEITMPEAKLASFLGS